ncbi:MAG: hypothetical protein IJ186_01595 [Bacilli bacterium]|nr:hypothetical protein [Bacilli bacterium]
MKKFLPLFAILSVVSLVSCGESQNEEEKPTPAETDEIDPNKKYDDTDLLSTKLSNDKPFEIKGDYVYFGEYPQTVKKENVTIDETDSKVIKNGDEDAFTCFKGSDGYYYAKVKSHTYNNNKYNFQDGQELITNTEYYFQVLPLKWRILSKDFNKDGNDGDYLLLTDRIVDSYAFTKQENYDSSTFLMTKPGVPEGTYANNYEYSDLRVYCNNFFYNAAFSDTQRALIEDTTYKNDKSTTKAAGRDKDTVTTCQDLTDKVFILSYEECHKEEYGFDKVGKYGDAERQLYCSDLSKANGNDIWPRDDYFYGMGIRWQRSAYPNSNEHAGRNSSHGYTYFYDNAYKDNGGVAPSIVLKVK